MEPDDLAHRPTRGKQVRKTSIRKHPLDEVLAQAGIVESTFLFDRQLRNSFPGPARRSGGDGDVIFRSVAAR
jgi:hypothetical protein